MLAIWSRDCNGSAAKRLFTDYSSPKLTDRFRPEHDIYKSLAGGQFLGASQTLFSMA